MHRVSHTSTPSLSVILKNISDDKSLALFNTIALSTKQHSILIRKMHLSTKQYYSRISSLANVGLIKRNQGGYSLTSLGRVVHSVNRTIEKTLSYYWKMKAIESIPLSLPSGLAREDLLKLINSLIDNHEIRDIMANALLSSNDDDVSISRTTGRKESKRQRIQKR